MIMNMFRITKAYENDATEIFRIEGQVSDENMAEWIQEIEVIKQSNGRAIILDLAHVWFISAKAVQALMGILSEHCYVNNCGMEVRNVFHVSGMSERMLG
jgi:anti-anti-sigma regulatory factor